MSDDIFFESASGAAYLESLAKTKTLLKDCPNLQNSLNELLSIEIELALIGAKKALGEVKKDTGKLVPIK